MDPNPGNQLTECIQKCKLARNKLSFHALTSLLLPVIAQMEVEENVIANLTPVQVWIWGKGSSHTSWVAEHMGPDRNRYLPWTGLYIPGGRQRCSNYWKRPEAEDSVPTWITESHQTKKHIFSLRVIVWVRESIWNSCLKEMGCMKAWSAGLHTFPKMISLHPKGSGRYLLQNGCSTFPGNQKKWVWRRMVYDYVILLHIILS